MGKGWRLSVVGGTNGLRRRLKQVVLAHEPEHALGVDDEAFVPEPSRDAPIALAAALGCVEKAMRSRINSSESV